ncbi:hypothetical protein A4G99_22215 [Haladaptatus sp. R4]|uniref:hypothetical protein n=1 Tax=Haladaptatus sp. R4 TaxID=1679489 RepID=UPI0007B48DC2|nr:hypothetical protein [Haladaptatus sp. R4]KZN26166.1 hypothetical protein A4G99_22215 [Haladaptatus sp. R4]
MSTIVNWRQLLFVFVVAVISVGLDYTVLDRIHTMDAALQQLAMLTFGLYIAFTLVNTVWSVFAGYQES